MVIEFSHKFIAVVAHVLVAGKETNLAPCFRQKNSGAQQKKYQPHNREEGQHFFLTKTPARFGKILEYPVVAEANREQMRHVFRGNHRTISCRRGPIVWIGIAVGTFGGTLSAQPKHICQQEEEQEKRILLGNAVKAYCVRVEGPQCRGNQRYLKTKQLSRA